MSLNLDNEELSLGCPNCNATVNFKVKQIGSSVICSKCNSKINLEDNGFSQGLKDLEKSLKNLFK